MRQKLPASICYINDGRTNFNFSATTEMRTIHDRIDCNSKNLIYMILSTSAKEAYLVERGQTLEPKGINKVTNEKKCNLMFNPLIPYVLYSILLSCHLLVYFNGLFFYCMISIFVMLSFISLLH